MSTSAAEDKPYLDEMSATERTAFLGGNIGECFARMGSPIDL